MSNLIVVKGQSIDENLMIAALKQVPAAGFSKTDFKSALVKQGVSTARDATRQIMQHLKLSGLIRYDANLKAWQLTPLGHMNCPGKTLPLIQTQSLPQMVPSDTVGLYYLKRLACALMIIALITLNGLFAWALGSEDDVFRFAFLCALLALDLMRPLFVSQGLVYFASSRRWIGALTLCIGLILSPVSILSSTSVISSSMQLGAEISDTTEMRAETLSLLQQDYAHLRKAVDAAKQDWEQECARGYCGPIAEGLEERYRDLQGQAGQMKTDIQTLTSEASAKSPLLARLVTSFEDLGLFGSDNRIFLPLLLALCLEIAALFGPALLLGRK